MHGYIVLAEDRTMPYFIIVVVTNIFVLFMVERIPQIVHFISPGTRALETRALP